MIQVYNTRSDVMYMNFCIHIYELKLASLLLLLHEAINIVVT